MSARVVVTGWGWEAETSVEGGQEESGKGVPGRRNLSWALKDETWGRAFQKGRPVSAKSPDRRGVPQWGHVTGLDHKKDPEDIPGGPVVKNLPANAEDPGSIPGLGRLYKLQGTKPKHPKVPFCKKRSHHNEKHTHHN